MKDKPVSTEIIPMAVLAREDDFEDEYEAKVDADLDVPEDSMLDASFRSLAINATSVDAPAMPGVPGRMRKIGLEFVWPTKYLPDVSIGSIVCFDFKPIETHGIQKDGVSTIPYLNNIYTNQVDRFGIQRPPIVPTETKYETEDEEEENFSRYGKSRGSTRSSARSGQSSRRSNRKK